MFARCLHFWAKMLVSWDRQTQSHWSSAVAPFRGGGCDAEGRGRVTSVRLVSPTRDGSSWIHQPLTHPLSPPLQSSYGGNTGRGSWMIGNFNPLKQLPRIRLSKYTPVWNRLVCLRHVPLFDGFKGLKAARASRRYGESRVFVHTADRGLCG